MDKHRLIALYKELSNYMAISDYDDYSLMSAMSYVLSNIKGRI